MKIIKYKYFFTYVHNNNAWIKKYFLEQKVMKNCEEFPQIKFKFRLDILIWENPHLLYFRRMQEKSIPGFKD